MNQHTDTYLPADTLVIQPKENPPMNKPLILTPGEQALLDAIHNPAPAKPAPTPEWTAVMSQFDAMFSAVVKYATPLIDRMVEEKFAALVASHHTLKQMDENMEQYISDMISEKISDHCGEYDHEAYERVVSEVDNNLDDKIDSALDNYDFSDKIERAIDDYDFNFESRISEAIDDYDMTDKINDAISDSETIVTTDGLAEALRHVSIRLVG
jgi:hypothetical protein